MKKDVLIEINNDSLKYKEFQKKNIISKKKKVVNSFTLKDIKNNFKNIRIDFKNKNLFIVIGGEEIYIKYMILPKVKDEKLYYVIKNELKHRFQNIDSIMFTYEIFKDMGNSLEVIVFCLNCNKLDLVETCMEKGAKIKGIFPIQFQILDNCRKNIKEIEYVIIFFYENILYFLACIHGKIVANSIVKEFNEENFLFEYEKFKTKYKVFGFTEKPEVIYFLNFPYKYIIEQLSKEYNCKELQDYLGGNIEQI